MLNAVGDTTVAMGFKQWCERPTVDLNSLDDSDKLPELEGQSTDDNDDARSDTGSDTSVATYDTNYFDDRVPHDEKPPCA